jgi:membrane fusion protein (multidrug efflux system)
MSHITPSLRKTVLGVLISSVLIAGCKSDAETAPPAPPPAAVSVVTLTAQDVTLTRELPGRANPSLIAEVRPQVSGIIEKRLFEEGGKVKAGQPLYQLDDSTYRADYASARASLERAEATLKVAELNARRSAELVKIDAVSRQDDENAAAALAQAKADVGVARAAVERNKVVLGYARITAPISGQVGKSAVTQGALVTANQPNPLVLVQRLDPMYVDVTQSSSELLELRQALAAGTMSQTDKMPVEIVLEDGTRYSHKGKLDFADVTVDPGTGSFLVRVTVPNPDNILLPGMYVRAIVGAGVRENGVLVPQQAIARDPKGNTSAMVVGKDNKVEVRQVKVNRTVGDKWLVDSGLAVGDRVIVEGLQKVRPGAPVTISATAQPAKPAAAPAQAGAKS